jgi:hypothetical protein
MSIWTNTAVVTYSLAEMILFLAGTLAFVVAIGIFRGFDFQQNNNAQYKLEKQSYLVRLLIQYALIGKIILLFYYVYMLDALAPEIPGAMCAVGVIGTSDWGLAALLTKIINIFAFGLWLLLDKHDRQFANFPYTRSKFALYLLIYGLYLIEVIFTLQYLLAINPGEAVACCATVFQQGENSFGNYASSIKTAIILPLFYGLFTFLVFFLQRRYLRLAAIFGVLFAFSAVLAVIRFFATYIYELPTHHCPFCLLQSEYYAIGYVLYSLLFLGTFYALSQWLLKEIWQIDYHRGGKALLYLSLFVFGVSFYVIRYYLLHGVWL